MATVKGGFVKVLVYGGKLRHVSLSGTVKLDNVGVARGILIYRKGDPDSSFSTRSDSSGNWSLDVPGNANSIFMIIAVGIDEENSEIYDHVQE